MPSKSSRRWLKEHFTDPYVKRAQQAGYRSRAVFKLLEIEEKYRLFRPGMVVVDLGAAPGGWSQIVSKLVKPTGQVIALDLLPIEPIDGVDIIQGDFTDDEVATDLLTRLAPAKVHWVISDMAPNMSGNEIIDIPRSMYLAELALDFALQVLQKDGGFLIKAFQGEGFDAFLATVRREFTSVAICKPKASRGRSREIFVLARGKK